MSPASASNRQSETRNAGTLPYVYSPSGSNRLFQIGSTSRYHTANGNTQSIGTTTFTYDGFNRLATARTAAETTTYTYNALGERIRKQNGLTPPASQQSSSVPPCPAAGHRCRP